MKELQDLLTSVDKLQAEDIKNTLRLKKIAEAVDQALAESIWSGTDHKAALKKLCKDITLILEFDFPPSDEL